jgi:hypothetical protein
MQGAKFCGWLYKNFQLLGGKMQGLQNCGYGVKMEGVLACCFVCFMMNCEGFVLK